MDNKRALISAACLLGVVAVSTVWLLSNPKNAQNGSGSTDDALLALIKNDQKAFEAFIEAGGKLHDNLPAIDGQVYTVAQGMSYFERASFMKYLHNKKVPYVQQTEGKPFDVVSLSIGKNNPELLSQMALENPKYQLAYGPKGWTLLHMASAACAHKLTAILHEKGQLRWDAKAKDGSTPLTIAAENDCLPMLSYWKEQKADFNKKDGRGLTALSILKKKKDAALMAFVTSFEAPARTIASVKAEEPNFYKKRVIPKDQIVDHSALIEPDERPLEATETAEYSEFAD
ncbi:ankyrin repeat domain-containing protein [Peredibacter starrii]|uniref:Ankyrin repeat domain-containing protein n=1 Tax=Peredibacter starrii TaxID=28202 RepID=A0AAX4HP55_9BACT|nr:ankyrin repeat domain-containing protein [Peredibacter starrii]WPU64749.1 hypothetical protein SOO65_18815 [Peredibacter starrii]